MMVIVRDTSVRTAVTLSQGSPGMPTGASSLYFQPSAIALASWSAVPLKRS